MGLLTTTELAFANVVATASLSQGLGLSLGNGIYRGLDNAHKKAPAVICWAQDGEGEIAYKTNVFPVNVTVFVKEIAVDTDQSQIGTLSKTIHDIFLDRDNIGNNLTQAAPNYFVFSVVPEVPRNEVEGDAHIQTFQFRIICCNT